MLNYKRSELAHLRYSLFVLVGSLFLASCVKDKPSSQPSAAVSLSSAKKVYVVNEGNYTSGNSSVSLFDKQNGTVVEDIYYTQNNSNLGDVAQSMCSANGKYYVVVNNSGRIAVCDQQFKKTAQINGLMSPRYMLAVSNQKAYVSDYKANALSIIDLNANSKTGSIPCAGWTEHMVMIYNKVFVSNVRKEFVYVINTVSDKIEDSVFVGKNVSGLVIDKYDKLWVLCSGDETVTARLSKINPIDNKLEAFWHFTMPAAPEKLSANGTKDTLYFINTHVYRMSILDSNLPTTAFIERGNKVFYGLGVDPNDSRIYLADVVDYVQKSNIYVYSANGGLVHNFKAGIIANGFYFE